MRQLLECFNLISCSLLFFLYPSLTPSPPLHLAHGGWLACLMTTRPWLPSHHNSFSHTAEGDRQKLSVNDSLCFSFSLSLCLSLSLSLFLHPNHSFLSFSSLLSRSFLRWLIFTSLLCSITAFHGCAHHSGWLQVFLELGTDKQVGWQILTLPPVKPVKKRRK